MHLSKFGCLNEFHQLDNSPSVYKCTFYDIRAAFEAKKVSNITIKDSKFVIYATLIEVYEQLNVKRSNGLNRSLSLQTDVRSRRMSIWLNTPESLIEPSSVNTCANNILMNATQDEWRKYQQLKHRRLASLPFGTPSIPEENKIVIENIENGIDNRKTLMIRNIPNKIKHQELEDFVNVTNLRIDFENHCNVGYAFISFTDPKHIIKFYKERAGKKWNKFNSDKVCELAYAKIQGKEKLIQKFRHSKVMEQSPEYQPRIYHTSGPLKGQLEQFPEFTAPNSF
ncbi:unnamed protein product [Ambrosiozyma monospora]|uniref:Unnamed protein product n=1 Tax=Ambrosiozyma monospora TaxID=43982 RepID=A0ACB5TCN1_AMBMO|nr:unnamed protein product [Ambrosiozyma monospora]